MLGASHTSVKPDLSFVHPRLLADCFWVCDLSFSTVLLMNNAHWPWLIVVPRGVNLVELQDMDDKMRHGVWGEVNRAGSILQKLFQPKKINTAALGNMVPQLHIHVIARFENDIAWPKPVWCIEDKKAYEEKALHARMDDLRLAFAKP